MLCPKRPERLVRPDAQDTNYFFPDVGCLVPLSQTEIRDSPLSFGRLSPVS